MKNTILMILFLLPVQVFYGQQNEIDSLKNIVKKQGNDTSELKALMKIEHIYVEENHIDSASVYTKVALSLARSLNYSIGKDSNAVFWLIETASYYRFSNLDSSIFMAKEAVNLAHELNFKKGEGYSLIALGEDFRLIGDFPKALEALFDALRISKDLADHEMEESSLDFIGITYVDLGEYRQGLNYLFQAKKINDNPSSKKIIRMISFRLCNIGQAYEKINRLDSALYFQQEALRLQSQTFDLRFSPLQSLILIQLGVIQYRSGNSALALNYYRGAIRIGDVLGLGIAQFLVAQSLYSQHQLDSSLFYARLAFINSKKSLEKTFMLDESKLLVEIYKAKHQLDSAFRYQELAMTLKDSLFGPEKFRRLQLLAINEQQHQQQIIQRQKEIQQEKERFEDKIKMLALLATLGVFLLLAVLLYGNNRQKQKANILLQQQKQKVETTLAELKSTQSQLVQREKMASLGELTAGIAHEIQNPLNFVNNFSEVNTELLMEMKKEINKGNVEEVKALANDIEENEQKINHHGRRADAIVKGMLQHSKTSTGKKEPTDINALADEYLRLSYHGFRANDKSFNAAIETNFDESIGKIEAVPQDIGRVLLNLFNNAFYAVNEKKKQLDGAFEPIVTVSTERSNDKVQISVKDNGAGIPQKAFDKIFQPFFTTKPTGQGTGLGLSLSYDIIKAHGAEIRVESKEGEGSTFVIEWRVE